MRKKHSGWPVRRAPAVINASLYGVITEGKAHPEHIDTVYGMVNGIEGFLSGRCMDLSQSDRGGP